MHIRCFNKQFFKLTGAILWNSKEVGISDEVFEKIKELKIRTKKNLIRTSAEKESMMIDIIAALWDRNTDITKVHEMIDKKYELKRQGMRELASGWFSLKTMLTQEQMEKAWKFYKEERFRSGEKQDCCERC